MMHIPSLNRKQKLLRNLALLAVAIFLLSWMMEFPAWSKAGLLRRAEQRYLLEGSELLFEAENNCRTLYARNGTLLLETVYDPTPLGFRLVWSRLLDEPDELYCDVNADCVTARAIGWMEGVETAELTMTMEITVGETELRETYVTQGMRENPNCFVFRLQPHYAQEDERLPARAERGVFTDGWHPEYHNSVLRLYDAEGKLLHEKTIEWFAYQGFAR